MSVVLERTVRLQQAADRRERHGWVGTAWREGSHDDETEQAYASASVYGLRNRCRRLATAVRRCAERRAKARLLVPFRTSCGVSYIAAVEGPDRAEFVKQLIGMLEWVNPESRKPRFQQLRDGNLLSGSSLRRVHLDVTADEASVGITLLDKFGVLTWFTGGDNFALLEDGSDFQDRLGALQRLNGRWTYELVTRLLRELIFTGTPRELVDARKRRKTPTECSELDRELNGAAHDIVPNVPTDKRLRTAG